MKKFKNHTLAEYLTILSKREPVPGGGSVAALTGALATGLLSMVAEYSLGKGKPKKVENKIRKIAEQSQQLRQEFLELVDGDAQAYLTVVKARKGSAQEKKRAKRQAAKVPKDVCKLSYKAVQLAPYLVEHGNQYLISDVEIAVELLVAAFNSSMINVEINQ